MHPDWNAAWRQQTLPTLADETWDLIVIGGGISGAGILREAARRGWRCLLLEQRDFAWGTSSRSSKMVHGGLRYIAKGQWRLTRDSVRERQRLLDEAPGLVEPMSFMMPHYRGGFTLFCNEIKTSGTTLRETVCLAAAKWKEVNE